MTYSDPALQPLRPDEILRQSADLAADVVDDARIALMTSLRFMDVALWRMPLATKRLGRAMATDGYLFYLDPVAVIGAYKGDRNEIARDYLHAVLHCVFRHPFLETPHFAPAAIPDAGARSGLASANG